ncbi:MAG: L,D-transpeptidase family protein [Rhodobacteraceae bacterium]|nr:L,D-transpeptidase family protein [Paracoccaceae bacterium]
MKLTRRTLLASAAAAAVASPVLANPEIADMVVVFKSSRRMVLYSNGTPLRDYDIGLGWAPTGNKSFEGDGRTPEGSYYINRRNPNSAFHLSLGISYPDPNQVAAAAAEGRNPGGEIFIHGGLGKRRQLGDWTAGCIAVSDREIEEIWQMVPNGALVVIQP